MCHMRTFRLQSTGCLPDFNMAAEANANGRGQRSGPGLYANARGNNFPSQRGGSPLTRGRNRGGSGPPAHARPGGSHTSRNATLLQGLGNVLHNFELPSGTAPTNDRVIQNFQAVGSYSWTNGIEPTIIVPSSAPIWKDAAVPFTLQPDRGKTFADQNAARVPLHPLLPLVAAIDYMHATGQIRDPDFSFADFEVVTDRNGLRKLAGWVGGSKGSSSNFRIDVQLAGDTMLFTRHEPRAVVSCDQNTFGKGFEHAMTLSGVSVQTGHHRIVKYSLGGVQILLRCEIDACLPDARRETDSGPLQRFAITAKIPAVPGILIVGGGALTEQSRTMELKTKSHSNGDPRRPPVFDWPKSYLQMVLGQIEHHAVGFHRNGAFSTITRSTLQSMQDRVDAELIDDQL
ncbi:hypothetical protein BKA62DRAFT_729034, partial [Auriculariales sp. MPI-PUGE-AT-0066]